MQTGKHSSFSAISSYHRALKIYLFISGFLVVAACGQKKETPANADFDPLQISISKFQDLSPEDWKISQTGAKLLTNLSTLSFDGVCGPKVVAVIFKRNGTAVTPNLACDANGLWSYSGALAGADGDTTIEVIGLDEAAVEGTAYAISKTVHKDTLAPTISGITAPFDDPQIVTNAAVAVMGNLTGDAFGMTSTDSTGTFSLNLSGGTFNFGTFINEGETRTITFRVFDETGNTSAPVSQTFTRYGDYPSISPPMAMYTLSGMNTVSGAVMPSNGMELIRVGQTSIGGDLSPTSGGYNLNMGLIYQTTRY